jgi:DNA adenine methylase
MKSYSPLRYPGGKGKFYKYLIPILNRNNIKNSIYVEPFAGGAGLACELLIREKVSKLLLNDYDRSIYAFWYSILNYTDEFCEKILSTNITMNEREIQKSIQLNKINANLLDLGFSTFFLNRTNRSGIIKGGPISGSDYPLDCRFNKEQLITVIRSLAAKKENIEITNLDAIDLLKSFKDKPKKEDHFLFIDPPYYHNGKKLYVNFYKHDDHLKLSKAIMDNLRDYKWILTYDYCPEIKQIYNEHKKFTYKDFKKKSYTLSYTAGKARKGIELLYYNSLIVPNIK